MALDPANVAGVGDDRDPIEDGQHGYPSGGMAPGRMQAAGVSFHLGREWPGGLSVVRELSEDGVERFGHGDDGSWDGGLSGTRGGPGR